MKNFASKLGINSNSLNDAIQHIDMMRTPLPKGKYDLVVVAASLYTRDKQGREYDNPIWGFVCKELKSGARVLIRLQYNENTCFESYTNKIVLLLAAIGASYGDLEFTDAQDQAGFKQMPWKDLQFQGELEAYVPKNGGFKQYYNLGMVS
jgi:hypothetical protein